MRPSISWYVVLMALSHNYSLRLDADQRAKLEEIARRKDRELSYVIRKAIDEYIERHQHDTSND
jgi:predicted transcriptional regulator